jgi:hypothetical protein
MISDRERAMINYPDEFEDDDWEEFETYEQWAREHSKTCYENTHDLGYCLRFARNETCVGCGDTKNGDPLPEHS